MEDRLVDIGPELFQDVEHAIQSDLCQPLLAGLGPGAFTGGIIGVRNSGAGPVANNFRNVKGGVAGIGSAVLGRLADETSINFVFVVCSFLPFIGLLTAFLPDLNERRAGAVGRSSR